MSAWLTAGRMPSILGEHGTKAAAHYVKELAPGELWEVRLRLNWRGHAATEPVTAPGFAALFEQRREEAEAFYAAALPPQLTPEARVVARQACAGLLWSKQFYHYVVQDWLRGDPEMPVPPAARLAGRNAAWEHLFARDVLSMPDKWEYPWFAAWDLGFHMLPFARLDPVFAKEQLLLLLREWYMHPKRPDPGLRVCLWRRQSAGACLGPPGGFYKIAAPRGGCGTVTFWNGCSKNCCSISPGGSTARTRTGRSLFAGGFLGLDNIGVFDRSRPLPTGGRLQQADGTAWMAFYCLTMMEMAMELACDGAGGAPGLRRPGLQVFRAFHPDR